MYSGRLMEEPMLHAGLAPGASASSRLVLANRFYGAIRFALRKKPPRFGTIFKASTGREPATGSSVNGDTLPALPAGQLTLAAGTEQPSNSAPNAATTTMAVTAAERAGGSSFRIRRHNPAHVRRVMHETRPASGGDIRTPLRHRPAAVRVLAVPVLAVSCANPVRAWPAWRAARPCRSCHGGELVIGEPHSCHAVVRTVADRVRGSTGQVAVEVGEQPGNGRLRDMTSRRGRQA